MGGGVAILIRKDIEYNRISIAHSTRVEIVGISIKTEFKPLNIYALYNKPQSTLNLNNMKRPFSSDNLEIFVGDLNAKHASLGCKVTNQSGIELLKFAENSNPTIVNQGLDNTYIEVKRNYSEGIDWIIANPNATAKISHTTIHDNGELKHFP